jgi:DNA-binding transcriptional regulator YiaG
MTPATLTSIRKASSFTRRGLAEYLQISRDTLRGYENGVRDVPAWLALAVTAIGRGIKPDA